MTYRNDRNILCSDEGQLLCDCGTKAALGWIYKFGPIQAATCKKLKCQPSDP